MPNSGALTAIGTDTARLTAARAGALTDWIDGGRLDLLLDAIPTTAMRGTDNAALASVATEARLAELDAANIPTDAGRLTAARAQVLDDWINGGRLDLLLDGDNGLESAHQWLTERSGISSEHAHEVVNYISLQKSFTQIPNRYRIVVEKYIDSAGSENILVLAIYGKETNTVIAHALAKALTDIYNVNIASITTDNGFLLRLPVGLEFNHKDLFALINCTNLEGLITKAVRESELFRNRFRYAINRSLMILQKYGKRKISVDQQQKITRWLLKILPQDFLIAKETIREILYDTYNFEKANLVIQEIESGTITIFEIGRASCRERV